MGSWLLSWALVCRPWCQPSTSLLVLTDFIKTDQEDGGQVMLRSRCLIPSRWTGKEVLCLLFAGGAGTAAWCLLLRGRVEPWPFVWKHGCPDPPCTKPGGQALAPRKTKGRGLVLKELHRRSLILKKKNCHDLGYRINDSKYWDVAPLNLFESTQPTNTLRVNWIVASTNGDIFKLYMALTNNK